MEAPFEATRQAMLKLYPQQEAGIGGRTDAAGITNLFPRDSHLDSSMHDTPTATSRSHEERERIHRRDLLNSLLIGAAIGTVLLGPPLGWFAHRFYVQQRAAQVLLCRQQNFGMREAELQARCGQPY